MSIKKILFERQFDPAEAFNLSDGDSSEFNQPLSKKDLEGLTPYYGRDVIWYGYKGTVIKVHKDDVRPVDGQSWDVSKLRGVKKFIEQSEDRVKFIMGWGMVTIIDITDIQEQQQAVATGNFDSDYSQTEAASIGDNELDEFIGDPRLYVEDNWYYSDDEILRFIEDHILQYDPTHKPREELIKDFKEHYPDFEPDDLETIKEWLDIEEEIYEAVQRGDGDIGQWSVQMRDGNHRTFGAIAAGEEYVFVMIEPNDPHYSEEVRKELI